MKPRPTAIYGFTLIELMISAVLVAMMGVLIMASIHSSVASKDSAEKLSQRFQEGNQAIARMSREISMAYLSKILTHLIQAISLSLREKRIVYFLVPLVIWCIRKTPKRAMSKCWAIIWR